MSHLILYITPIALEILLDRFSMRYFHDREESIKIPKYFTYFSSIVDFLLIRRVIVSLGGLLKGWKITMFVVFNI